MNMPPISPPNFPRSELAAKMATATVQVVFAYRNGPTDWEFRRLPLHGTLQSDFRTQAEAAAVDLRDNRAGRSYDPQWELQHHEFFYLSNSPPVGGNFFTQLPAFAKFQDYQERKRIRQPNALVVIAQLSDGTIAYFGKRITASSVLERRSAVLRIIYREGVFDTLDDTVVTFGDGFDWLTWQDVMIVLSATDFRMTFRDIPALIAQVDANIAAITQHVAIGNIAAFTTRIKAMPGMMVKLQGIVDRADMHTKPASVLRKYASDYSIHVEWDGDEMIFDDSVENQWNILRLLDEARTLGPVTGKHWDTSSKVEV
jgi:ACT domain-containing protein